MLYDKFASNIPIQDGRCEVPIPWKAVADPKGAQGDTCTPLRTLYCIVLYSHATPIFLCNYIHTLVHPHPPLIINSWIRPWKEFHAPMADNYQLCEKRLKGLLKHLRQEPEVLRKYHSTIQKILRKKSSGLSLKRLMALYTTSPLWHSLDRQDDHQTEGGL